MGKLRRQKGGDVTLCAVKGAGACSVLKATWR